jgi:hypothetical protein
MIKMRMNPFRKYLGNTIYQLFENPDVSFSWSNTNDKGSFWDTEKDKRVYLRGPAWQQGRARLTIGDWDGPGPHPACFNFQWSFLSHSSTHISFDVGGEEDVKFGIAINRLFSLWLTTEYILPNWVRKAKWFQAARYSGWGRSNGISLAAEFIFIELWHDRDDYSSKQAKWHQITIHWKDLLMGKSSYSKRTLGVVESAVEMPEGNYPCKVEMFESTWKRTRWPFAKKLIRADVQMYKPVPHPGKGENSWDQDDDATYSMTCMANNPDEAIDKLAASVNRERRKYGGRDWKPEKVS